MADETETEVPEAAEERKVWRPSRPADHRGKRKAAPGGIRLEQPAERPGLLAWLRQMMEARLFRVVAGVALFTAAVVVFDMTVNGGSWTERARPLDNYRTGR